LINSFFDSFLPWWQETKDNEDLNEAEAILNADHYGLEKVKDRNTFCQRRFTNSWRTYQTNNWCIQ